MKAKVLRDTDDVLIRIPAQFVENDDFDDEVEIELLDGIILVKSKSPKYTLEELLKGITSENLHPETDWGPDVGKEIIEPYEL